MPAGTSAAASGAGFGTAIAACSVAVAAAAAERAALKGSGACGPTGVTMAERTGTGDTVALDAVLVGSGSRAHSGWGPGMFTPEARTRVQGKV